MVEFAVVAPVLFLFLIGGLEFGFLIYEYHATDYAARSAARWASVHGANCGNTKSASPAWTVCPTTSANVKTFVKSTVPGLQTRGSGFNVQATWATPAPATYASNSTASMACTTAAQAQGCLVTVTVTNPVTIRIPLIHLNPFTLRSTSTAVVQ